MDGASRKSISIFQPFSKAKSIRFDVDNIVVFIFSDQSDLEGSVDVVSMLPKKVVMSST